MRNASGETLHQPAAGPSLCGEVWVDYGRIVFAVSVAVDTIVRSVASRASATRYVPALIRQPGSDVS